MNNFLKSEVKRRDIGGRDVGSDHCVCPCRNVPLERFMFEVGDQDNKSKARSPKIGVYSLILIVGLSLTGCRGWLTDKPPVHINPNMDWQAKIKPQTSPMTPPEGTVPWGRGDAFVNPGRRNVFLIENEGSLTLPVPVTLSFVERGKERYGIYCAVCHDGTGSGRGTVVKRGFVLPPNFSDPRILALSDGDIFKVISDGVRNMPAYRKQIPERDRWAIVAYVRTLQKMRTATLRDVPEEMKNQLE